MPRTPPPKALRIAVDAALSVALAAWLALAAAGGIAAAGVFPRARELGLSLEGYAQFLAAEPEQGRMLVAGHLVERVFMLVDGPRMVVAVACVLLALVARRLGRLGGAAGILALAAVAAAALSCAIGVYRVQPSFQEVDGRYRAKALAGEVADALVLKKQVDAAHTLASRVASAEVLAVLLAVAAAAAAARRDGAGAPAHA
ncbi:MAG: hypothetical protein ACKOYN_09545 [Planctomycetota bacterium]